MSQFASAPMAIMAAMPEELQAVLDLMEPGAKTVDFALRRYHIGRLAGHDCILALSRIGKVAAATTTATLIHRFGVRAVILTGLAGGLGAGVKVGDVVIGHELLQYDLDARPLFPRFEAPLLGVSRFFADPELSQRLAISAQSVLRSSFLAELAQVSAGHLYFANPSLHQGLVVTGDRFLHGENAAAELCATLPDALCCEMEGAAMAQVCYEFGVPFAVLRTISDRADQTASIDFADFLKFAAGPYAARILQEFLQKL